VWVNNYPVQDVNTRVETAWITRHGTQAPGITIHQFFFFFLIGPFTSYIAQGDSSNNETGRTPEWVDGMPPAVPWEWELIGIGIV
jgi:hypothetical protein